MNASQLAERIRPPLDPRKLPNVASKYGAPMGRQGDVIHNTPEGWRECSAPRSVRVQYVPFVDGCYDNGGAYWGSPANLYLVQWHDEFDGSFDWCFAFVRGDSREAVIRQLNIPRESLAVPARFQLTQEVTA